MWMCWLCQLPVAKNHNFGQILTFLGATVPTPFYRREPNSVCYSRPMVYVYMPNFMLIGLFCRPLAAKNTNFAIFWTSAFSDVDSWRKSEKVEHGCTTTKIAFVLQCLHGEIGRTNSDVQNRDEQTDKQKLNVFGGWKPSPTKLGTVIEDLEHVLAPLELLRLTHSFTARGRWKFGDNQTPSLKTPITP